MLKALIKANLGAFTNWFKNSLKVNGKSGKSSKGGKGKLIAYALLLLYCFGVFCWLFGQMFMMLAEPLYLAGCGWLFFIYVFIMAFALMFIFSAFAAKNRLYESKDNDLLLSLPIPAPYILGTRMLMLLLINLATGLVVVGPAIVVWFMAVPFDFGSLVTMLAVFLALSLFALAISALFGWVLSKLSSRMRKKALLESIASLVFLALYFYGYSQINQIVQKLLVNSESIAASMSSISPLYWIGAGAAGELKEFAFALLLLVIPFIIVYWVLSRTFVKTATAKRGGAKVKYVAKEQKVSSGSVALIKREAARFFSSSTCIVNNGLGAIFLLCATAALLIYRSQIDMFLTRMPELYEYAVGIGILAVSLMAGMVQPTSSSVALEGKSIWIVQSMPVSPAQALLAKLKLSLIMYIPPVVICMAAVAFVVKPGSEITVLAIIVPVAIIVVMAEIGLISNVNHPALDWTTESQAVKSGIAVLISMLIDMGITAAVGFAGYFMLKAGMSLEAVLTVLLVVMLVAARVLYKHIIIKSAQKFANL